VSNSICEAFCFVFEGRHKTEHLTTTINLAHFVDFIFRRASTKKLAPSVFECQKCSG